MGSPEKKLPTVLYIGQNGFPIGLAGIQRQLNLAKAMASIPARVVVISRKGVHDRRKPSLASLPAWGSTEGINFLFASGTPFYPEHFIPRNLLKIKGFVCEQWYIIYARLFLNARWVLFYSSSYPRLRYYRIFTRLLGQRLILDYVEFKAGLENRKLLEPSAQSNFDRLAHRYADGMIIISSFLRNHVRRLNPSLPIIVIPPVMDFTKLEIKRPKPPGKPYFLYCGSIQYRDVVDFILTSWRESNCAEKGFRLILVVNSHKIGQDMASLFGPLDDSVALMSGLLYEELLAYYQGASGLLIPLMGNLQDNARFPFKLCEYTAAGRPIITSDSGAILEFFRDGENALVAKTGDPLEFAMKMRFVADHPEEAEKIGQAGHQTGLDHFNYASYTGELKRLIFG